MTILIIILIIIIIIIIIIINLEIKASYFVTICPFVVIKFCYTWDFKDPSGDVSCYGTSAWISSKNCLNAATSSAAPISCVSPGGWQDKMQAPIPSDMASLRIEDTRYWRMCNPGNSASLWPFWGDGEFPWPLKRRMVTFNYGMKRSRIESPGSLDL